jgi:hypothetical protein
MMQIGSNDLCQLCLQSQIGIGPGSPDDFEANIRAVLEYLKAHLRKFIPHLLPSPGLHPHLRIANTIVNLSGVFKLSGIYQVRVILPANCHPTNLLAYS